MNGLNKLNQDLQELKALFINGVVSKEWYLREIDDRIRYASNKEEIELINKYKDLDI